MARRSTSELVVRLRDLTHEYDGKVSNAEVVGALEFVKAEIVRDAFDDDEDEGEDD